ncbi:MAG TPA: hypothetical protein VGD74_04075, partial [Vulgatibacter sp.]
MKRLLHALLAGVLLSACGAESGTGGREVAFRIAAESIPQGDGAPGVFVTRTGWSVTLEEAAISVGPLYLFSEAPPSASRLRPLGWLVPVAHAHSGFDDFDGGQVRGEYLGRFVIDALLPGLQPIASVRGIAGRVRSATVELQPPGGSPALLNGHQAWVRGVAVRGDETVPFEGGLDLPEGGNVRKVAGIPAAIDLDDGTTVVLELRVERWLSEADFSSLPPDGNERRTLAPGTQPYN